MLNDKLTKQESPARRQAMRAWGQYTLFIAAIVVKLSILHSQLHARYIDMNMLDYIIAIGSVMLVSFWTLWLTTRARTIFLIILNILLTFLIFADLVYYRYFGDFITVPVLMQAGQVGELGDSIRSLITLSDLWLYADWIICLLGFITITIWRATYKTSTAISSTPYVRSRSLIVRLLSGFIVFIMGLCLTMMPIQHYKNSWAGELFEGNWWNMSLYNVTGLLGFHYYDAYRYTKEHLLGQSQLSADEERSIRQWFGDSTNNRYELNDTFGIAKGSNVIIIQAEAFMNFIIGRTIEGQELTPNLNKLMNNSLYFSNFYHQTGQGRTSDADFLVQTSLHPLPSGSVFVRYPDHNYDALPLILKQNGYATAALHAYEGSFWNRNYMYKALGYDDFYSKKDFRIDEPLGWSLGDRSFFRQSVDYMSQLEPPFYSFLITLSSHHPYTLPNDVQQLDTGQFEGTMFGHYLESVHYVDAALGESIELLKQQGIWDQSILVFYGDHDNSITEMKHYKEFLGEKLDPLGEHQIMNQVPLLIHVPEGKLAGVRNEPTGQIDLAPSLLHLLGISTEQQAMMGNNMFGHPNYFVVQRTGAFSTSDLYYIPSPDQQFENGSCFDLTDRAITNIETCRVPYEEANNRLRISDSVITSNYIEKLRLDN